VGWKVGSPRGPREYYVVIDGREFYRRFKTLDEVFAYIDRAKLEDAWAELDAHNGG
jgi:hypothetical protein